ncbi:hypothetical protein JCM11491_003658 [Sporobolomyces phaffii]
MMERPTVPTRDETFPSLEALLDRVNLSVFLDVGYSCKSAAKGPRRYFQCSYGRRDVATETTRCAFSLFAQQISDDDARWRIVRGVRTHNHPRNPELDKDPRYRPVRNGPFAQALNEYWDQEDARRSASTQSRGSPSTSGTPATLNRRQRSESLEAPGEKRRRQDAPEVELAPAEETKPRIGPDSGILVLSDEDDSSSHHDGGDIQPGVSDMALNTFLDSLSTTFRLSKYAGFIQGPRIGLETEAQVMEVARTHLDGLINEVKGMIGFGPAMALKKGLQDVLEAERNRQEQ